MLQCYFNGLILYHSRKNLPTVSFQSKRLRRSVEPRRGAGRRNLGTRVRHRYQTIPAYKSSAKPHHIKNLHLLLKPKTSPKSTRKKQSEPNLRSAKAGALGGSSGKVREVWRVGNPLRKRVSCASKVFLPPQHQAQDIVVGFSSVMITLFRKSTALRKPSSIVMTLSSCSIDRTRS